MEHAENIYTQAMQRAIVCAQKGKFKAAPNPCVGAVLIKDNALVAEGYHAAYGQAHAEVACINHAKAQGIDTKGTTLVVTLEPCNHHGKTPPCTEAIIAAGIKKVVVGTRDPHATASGGIACLREQGIEVVEDVLKDACEELIEDFKIWILQNRPYCILKMGTTLDGKIATKHGRSSYITNESSRLKVAELRAQIGLANGVVLVGTETFLMDNPKLSARNVVCEKQPKAAVVTRSISQCQKSYLVQERPQDTIIFTTNAQAASPLAALLREKGVKIYGVEVDKCSNRLDLKEVFNALYEKERCPYILCEGGARTAFSLLESKLADEYRQYIAPTVFGDSEAKSVFEGNSLDEMSEVFRFSLKSTQILNEDIELIYKPIYTNT